MSSAQSRNQDSSDGAVDEGFPGLLRAAEAGHTWAQLQLAEHYSQTNGSPGDPVAAYMWCLLSEKTAASMRNRIESGKDTLIRKMSPEQVREAEQRAVEWLKNTLKKSTFAKAGDPQAQNKKMLAGAP